MSYLFCGPVNFPTEALSPADSGSSRNSEKKRPEQKNSFQLFFFFRFHSFLSLLPPSLLELLYPFLLQDRSNWSPGGSYRECIGSLGEKSPQQAIHQMYNVIWSNWQTQKLKNKRRELGRGIQRRVFKTARPRAWIPLLRLNAWKKRC